MSRCIPNIYTHTHTQVVKFPTCVYCSTRTSWYYTPDPVLVQTLHDGVPVVDDLHEFGHQFFFSFLVPRRFHVFCSHRVSQPLRGLGAPSRRVSGVPTWFLQEPPELLLNTWLLFFQLLRPAAVPRNTASFYSATQSALQEYSVSSQSGDNFHRSRR